jgi:hypothetical protein
VSDPDSSDPRPAGQDESNAAIGKPIHRLLSVEPVEDD